MLHNTVQLHGCNERKSNVSEASRESPLTYFPEKREALACKNRNQLVLTYCQIPIFIGGQNEK